jgi:hypothetical protein
MSRCGDCAEGSVGNSDGSSPYFVAKYTSIVKMSTASRLRRTAAPRRRPRHFNPVADRPLMTMLSVFHPTRRVPSRWPALMRTERSLVDP